MQPSDDGPEGDYGPRPLDGAAALLQLASFVSAAESRTLVPVESSPPAHQDWTASLQFVREVAERVRDAQQRSNVVASEARQVARNAIVAMWEAEERALKAEADAAAALARAEDAEEQLRQLRSQPALGSPANPGSQPNFGAQPGLAQPLVGGVDRWLHEAYHQLRLASEKRPDPSSV